MVSPFYLKNLIIFDKFAISAASIYEHLNQKIDYIKEMKDPNRHSRLRSFFLEHMKIIINLERKDLFYMILRLYYWCSKI